MASGEVALN